MSLNDIIKKIIAAPETIVGLTEDMDRIKTEGGK